MFGIEFTPLVLGMLIVSAILLVIYIVGLLYCFYKGMLFSMKAINEELEKQQHRNDSAGVIIFTRVILLIFCIIIFGLLSTMWPLYLIIKPIINLIGFLFK